MVRQTRVDLIDDIDQTPAVSTVTFSVDRQHYEIDLNEDHVAEFHSDLGKWIAAARKVSVRRTRAGSAANLVTHDAVKIREWAKDQDVYVAERGRIPNAVIEQYVKATRGV